MSALNSKTELLEQQNIYTFFFFSERSKRSGDSGESRL